MKPVTSFKSENFLPKGLFVISEEDINRIRDLAKHHGFYEELVALDITIKNYYEEKHEYYRAEDLERSTEEEG